MDPVNPFTNVADPQAHLRRQLQPFAYGTRVRERERERELERVQFARLETNDFRLHESALNLDDGCRSPLFRRVRLISER